LVTRAGIGILGRQTDQGLEAMSEQPVVIGINSPEYVAYQLFQHIAFIEGARYSAESTGTAATRQWILDTYAECVDAVRQGRARKR
jgi:hypothetical protein